MAKSYKELEIWNKGIEIADKIYDVTSNFPKEETYGIAAQMRRSAISIPSNIAEGFARQFNREYRQFLYVALGSCAELETQVVLAHRRNYMSAKNSEELGEKIDHESRMLTNMIKAVSRSLRVNRPE